MEQTKARAKQNGGEKPYILPPWRRFEIVLLAVKTLGSHEWYEDGFDFKKMIESEGIQLKAFSSLAPEQFAAFRRLSLSGWENGLCVLYPDPESGKQRRMIVYNDRLSDAACMQILFHEYGHIKLRHTQQSENGEVEANCFALVMTLLVILERKFHLAKALIKREGRMVLARRLQAAIRETKKEVI